MAAVPSGARPLLAFGSGLLDDVHGRAERGVYILVRGVEQGRVPGLPERCDGAAGVAGVALPYFGKDALEFNLPAFSRQFVGAPAGAHFRAGGDVDLDVGMGHDGRADVAAVEHRT